VKDTQDEKVSRLKKEHRACKAPYQSESHENRIGKMKAHEQGGINGGTPQRLGDHSRKAIVKVTLQSILLERSPKRVSQSSYD
jgi:hypothetical protein